MNIMLKLNWRSVMSKIKELFPDNDTWELKHIFNKSEFTKYKGRYSNAGFLDIWQNESPLKKNEYEKLSWTAHNQMMCRFWEAAKHINWNNVHTWLDLGCGTGDFFKYVLDNTENNIEEIVGVDLTQDFLDITKQKLNECNVKKEFINHDITTFDLNRKFDLITVSGIIQCLNIEQLPLLMERICSHLNEGGKIWFDTINYDYRHKRRYYIVWTFKEAEIIKLFEHYGFNNLQATTFNITPKKDENKQGFFLGVWGHKKG